jgi:hypothetical protein
MTEEANNNIRSCGTCHYSSNGKHGCNRLMDYAKPKIDLSKGVECAHNDYVHYLKFGSYMTEEEKDLWRSVHWRINDEGLHYCFVHYSRWTEIKDEEFHKLREIYLASAKALEEYVNKKEKETKDQ